MGCKFGKVKSEEDYSQEKNGSVDGDRIDSDYYNNSTLNCIVNDKTAKYQAQIDKRVTLKYDIKALIGRGTFSEVLRVESKISKQPFAVKIVKIQTDIEKQLSSAELGALAKISHHFIVRLEEVIISKSVMYLVMQLATGGELYDRIKSKGSFDEKYCCHITQMLLEAVFYLHLNGIIHRDLKPENILFYHPGHDSKILITDFGFAKVQSGHHNDYATTWCGTPEYIAPELLQKTPYDCKVDIWAIGVLVYVMLSGHLPFSAPTTAKLFNLILNGVYSYKKSIWSLISDTAKEFIDRLLVVNPLSRLDARHAMSDRWLKLYTPLHKTSSILQNLYPVKKREKIVTSERILDVPHVIEMSGILNEKNHNEEKIEDKIDKFYNSADVSGTLYYNDEERTSGGFLLPDIQEKIITKENILEDNTSSLSQSNLDSRSTQDYSNANSSTNQKDTKNEKLISSLKSNFQEKCVHTDFDVIDEISEDEANYNILTNPIKINSFPLQKGIILSQNSSQNITKTCYIEKVGVWLNKSSSGQIEETSFITEKTKSMHSDESYNTLNKTESTDTNYHSAPGSSFDRFVLGNTPRAHEEVGIELKSNRFSSITDHFEYSDIDES